jgi:UDP-N-acetylmuramyl-tripeptide synthetase/UDP-N-acetylmuramoyl-tripeptide--D-alanyl-D-alanine ligase
MYGKSPLTIDQIAASFQKHGIFCTSSVAQDAVPFGDICDDSRQLTPGCLFVCISGEAFDGHGAIEHVLQNGASAVVVEQRIDPAIPHIQVTDSRTALALLAALLYRNLMPSLTLIGITGTNGKTTTTHMLYHLLQQCGKNPGMIGTLGYQWNDKTESTRNTTPGVLQLYAIFARMAAEGVDYIVMEVSSHALVQKRVLGLPFAAALFTNLTQDHLDFHGDMQQYKAAKALLFDATALHNGIAVINTDDAAGKEYFDTFDKQRYALSRRSGDVLITDEDCSVNGSRFTLKTTAQNQSVSSNFIGAYNIDNLALAITTLNALRIASLAQLAAFAPHIPPVPGRMEQVANNSGFGIFVDYAHTPDALLNSLACLRPLTQGRLICVFGAGGNRDATKRPLMLQAALQHSDLAFITTDNPRFEAPESIIADIIAGAAIELPWWIIQDRTEAIAAAVRFAQPGDCVLIAGKGHETYQEIKGVKHQFDDRETAAHSAKVRAEFSTGELTLPLDTQFLATLFRGTINEHQLLHHVSTDSRTIKSHSLFIPLAGEHFDGHTYLDAVLQDPTVHALSQIDYPHPRVLHVPDTLGAFGELAKMYKTRFGIPFAGITGSYGKTTCKEYLANILSQSAPILKTAGNQNNRIGVPQTLLHLHPAHRYGVIEMGTNQFGEIAALTHIVMPEIAIITSIGDSHLEFLRDRDGVFAEKRAIFDIPCTRIFPQDAYFTEFDGLSVGYQESADFHISAVRSNEHTHFMLNDQAITIATPFSVNAINAGFAAAAASVLQISPQLIASGLKLPLDVGNRMRFIHRGEQIWIADCYNANPDSMKASLVFWEKFQPQLPHIAILGDMLELGELTEKYHENIGDMLKNWVIERIVSVGKLSKHYGADIHFDSVESLLQSTLLQSLPRQAVILLKASHGIHLEKIVTRL